MQMYKLIYYFSDKMILGKIIMNFLKKRQFESNILRKIYKQKFGLDIGLYSYGCFDHTRFPKGTKIGRYCSFGPGIRIFNGNHHIESAMTNPYLYNVSLGLVKEETIKRNQLVIGHDVWIGANVIILPSVKNIGNGAIIGAGSIVTKDIPPYVLAVGNPSKILRKRFDKEFQDILEEKKLFLYSKEVLKKNLSVLYKKEEFKKIKI